MSTEGVFIFLVFFNFLLQYFHQTWKKNQADAQLEALPLLTHDSRGAILLPERKSNYQSHADTNPMSYNSDMTSRHSSAKVAQFLWQQSSFLMESKTEQDVTHI